MSDLDQFRATYFQECEELLGDLEEHLLTLQDNNDDIETLHAVFRTIHSIKGGGGAFGFERLVNFSHTLETLLDMMREGQVPTTKSNVETCVLASDIVADLVHEAQHGSALPAEHESAMLGSLQELISQAGGDAGLDNDDEDDTAFNAEIGFEPVLIDISDKEEDASAPSAREAFDGPNTRYDISFIPRANMLELANEPLLIFRELRELGEVEVTADQSNIPDIDAIGPETAYLSWQIKLVSKCPTERVREVFEFVEDDCDLKISSQMVEEKKETAPPPALTEKEKKLSQPSGGSPAAGGGAKAPPTVNSVRVDLNKLDNLVNMVGELVITQAMLLQQVSLLPSDQYPDMVRGVDELTQHTRGLQEGVMAMRAQPVKSVFARMPRLVRELAAKTGKKIKLTMIGETTEIDKTVIEQLSDPLVHMLRNSADHGLETPEERVAADKPEEGNIYLSAEHRGGKILIQIRDDGRGINRKLVMAKAIEKGLVEENNDLSDEQIDNLILQPGFSTASEVSDLSGRGVGMDVVVKNIQSLGGHVKLSSETGKGSCFSMTLPLTLAVLDGMIVRSGKQRFVIPLSNIVESLSPQRKDINTIAGDDENLVLFIRGDYLQIIQLHKIFGIGSAQDDLESSLIVIAETDGGSRVGLMVDEIIGQQQVVIKSLEDNFNSIDGIGAATILGNGEVSLILDLAGLKNVADARLASPGERAA
jgi:two-component system chemotaxis sensor kinase CheA